MLKLKSLCHILLIVMIPALVLPGCTPVSTTTYTDNTDFIDSSSTCGGNIYYHNFVDLVDDHLIFSTSDGQLSTAEPDGSGIKPLLEIAGSNFAYDGQTLFFTQGYASGKLMKINLDGTNAVRIGFTALKNLIVMDDTLYAIEAEQSIAVSLKLDGTNRQILSDSPASALLMYDGKILVIGVNEQNGLMQYDPQTQDSQLLINSRISSPNVKGEWLYYADPNDGNRLHAWSMEKSTSIRISQFSIDKPFIVCNDSLYFIDSLDNSRLYRHLVNGSNPISSKTATLVIDDAVGSFVVCQDYIYYRRPEDKRIYRVEIDGSDPIRIS